MADANTKKRLTRKLAIESLEDRRVMATLPYGAEHDDTGEFMLGRVVVTPVFLESDGTINPSTENWNTAQIRDVLNNIKVGLDWWKNLLATKSSVHTLDWVIDETSYAVFPKSTPYEPINLRSDAYAQWVPQFLQDIGYSSNVSIDANIRDFNNAQRDRFDADWAFTIFVVNSANDGDGSFAPGGSFSRAFAFAGGLFQVVPSTRPASTFTHETGHMFWARDEYSGGGNYYQRRGYYNTQNTNAVDLNPTNNFQQELSIMSAGNNLTQAYKDSDSDGIFDVLDVPLKLEGTGRANLTTNQFRFLGKASTQTLPNRNSSGTQNDITLNKIGRIEYRIDGGSWTTIASPNQYVADVDVSIPFLPGQQRIEIRAIDPRIGITSNLFEGSLAGTPDVTTQPGIQGFAWNDTNRNGTWDTTESGFAGATVSIVDVNSQPIVMQTIVEPDDFPIGQFINPYRGIRIDSIGEDAAGQVGVFDDNNTTTGTKIFKPRSLSANVYVDAFRGNDRQLRARFDTPTSFASIDAISIADDTDVRLEAFSLDGTLLERFERKGMLAGQRVTMSVSTESNNIAYVIARGTNNSFVKLDNLRVGPKNAVTTASDGSYYFEGLAPGLYRLMVGAGFGVEPTNPVSGVQTIVLSPGEVVSRVNYGLIRLPSPWQNPVLAEDVNNNGRVDPLDVLVLINEINTNQARALDGSGLTSPPYYDPTGDRLLSPLDVLQVINAINRPNGSGEGEELRTVGDSYANRMAAPFPSFVVDNVKNEPTTRIINSTNRRNRLSSDGPEKCGCPACTSCGPAGEYSPSLLDIASARGTIANTSVPETKSDPAISVVSFWNLEDDIARIAKHLNREIRNIDF
jgi:hypothetical protein